MKALFELFRRFDARRIFGFIRRLGGMSRPKVKCYDLRSTRALQVEGDTPLGLIQRICFIFLSTPSGWRATSAKWGNAKAVDKFLSTPSGWRATGVITATVLTFAFLSTPSGWRATRDEVVHTVFGEISIHALRVEGDSCSGVGCVSKSLISIHALRVEGDLRGWTGERGDARFLSTPSGWRATVKTPFTKSITP